MEGECACSHVHLMHLAVSILNGSELQKGFRVRIDAFVDASITKENRCLLAEAC